MLNTAFDDFIWEHMDTINSEDFRLTELENNQLDELVHIWLKTHQTWYPDIFPASFGTGVCKLATDMIWGKNSAQSKTISNLFHAMADDSGSDDRDDCWWCDATDSYLDEIVDLANFKDEYCCLIYLYLEQSIEEFICQRCYQLVRDEERDHGIYRSEIQGNC